MLALRASAVVVFLVATLSPVATAGAVTVTARGPLTADGAVGLQGVALALLDNDTSALGSLSLRAPTAIVHRFEWTYVSATPPDPAPIPGLLVPVTSPNVTYSLTDVALDLVDGAHAGWLGLYPGAGGLLSSSATTLNLLPEMRSRIGNSDTTTEDTPTPHFPRYGREIDAPHFTADVAGLITYDGPGFLKLMGPDVTLWGAENASAETIRTQAAERDAPLRQSTQTWLVIEFPAGVLQFDTFAPASVALATTRVAVDGTLAFSAAREGETEYVEGVFVATLTPSTDGRDAVAVLRVDGSVRAATLAPLIPPPSGLVGALPALLGAAGGLVVGAATVFLAMRRRRGLRPEDVGRRLQNAGVAAAVWAGLEHDYLSPERARRRIIAALDRWPWLARRPDLLDPFRGDPAVEVARADAEVRNGVDR